MSYTVLWMSTSGPKYKRFFRTWDDARDWAEANLLDSNGDLIGSVVPNAPLLQQAEDKLYWRRNDYCGITNRI